MAQTSMAEFYVRRSSVTSSTQDYIGKDVAEGLHAKEEMLAAYGA